MFISELHHRRWNTVNQRKLKYNSNSALCRYHQRGFMEQPTCPVTIARFLQCALPLHAPRLPGTSHKSPLLSLAWHLSLCSHSPCSFFYEWRLSLYVNQFSFSLRQWKRFSFGVQGEEEEGNWAGMSMKEDHTLTLSWGITGKYFIVKDKPTLVCYALS